MERLDFEPKFRGFEGKIDGFEGSVGEERVCGQRKEAEEEKFIEKARRLFTNEKENVSRM